MNHLKAMDTLNKRLKKKQKRKVENDMNNFNHLFNEHEKKIKKLVSEIEELNIPIWNTKVDYKKYNERVFL